MAGALCSPDYNGLIESVWASLEKWSWAAGIISTLLAVATLIHARHVSSKDRRDQETDTLLQMANLETLSVPGDTQTDYHETDINTIDERLLAIVDPAQAIRKRVEELNKSAAESAMRVRRLLKTATGFAIPAAIAYLIAYAIMA